MMAAAGENFQNDVFLPVPLQKYQQHYYIIIA